MSGPIRKLTGPAKSRGQRTTEEVEALLETVLEEDNFDGDEMKVKTLIHRLSSHVLMLEKCNKDWTGQRTEQYKGRRLLNSKNIHELPMVMNRAVTWTKHT